MALVLDASIAACWCYQDEHDVRADIAFDLVVRSGAIAPAHWWFELRNIFLVGERRRRISAQHHANFLRRLAVLPIEVAELPSEDAVFELARKHGLSFYDAAYLELALSKAIALATLDNQLAAACRLERVALVGEK